MTSVPHVLIVGAGLSGPCLANGLRRRAGWDVSLFDRDAHVTARGQGYRIHIAPEGDLALRSCLDPNIYQLMLDTSGQPGSGVTILDSNLKVLNRVPVAAGPEGVDDGAGRHVTVDRLTLRQILLAGLEGVHFGAEFVRYELRSDGGVRAHFADGRVVEGDILVAADGPGSRIRRQFLPEAAVVHTGQWAIFGKTPLTEEVLGLVPPAALDGFSTVVGSDGRYLPLAAHRFRTDPHAAAARLCPGLAFHDTRDYVMWVLGLPDTLIGEHASGLPHMDGTALRDLVEGMVADWHPSIGELVRRGDPATVTATAIRTSTPVEPWESGPVTLIGDAIHCMIPAGMGAAVALRDAALLASRLVEAHAAGKPLIRAIHAYEQEMLVYGFEAVAASQRLIQGLSR